MKNEDNKKVTIEKNDGRVLLTIDGVQMSMSPSLARELGDALYKCGCDVAAQQH
jgi:hypothetical protein